MSSPVAMDEPLIDVLIPVYNAAPWLRQSIDSILQQSHRALRVHVVDDGSTDESPTILRALAAADTRVRVHRQRNGGIVDALNHGLSFCTAEWVARHDADDVADPQRLQRQLEYLQANPACVAVGAMARHIDGGGTALGTVTQLRPPDEADAAWVPAREPYLMHPFMMARRAALLAAGGYRPVLHAEDSDLYWRLREHGRLHNLPQVLGSYRMHGASISSGSLHNGRLMAVGSQLAALSARRRQQGLADIPLSPERSARLRQAPSLAGMVALAATDLAASERAPFSLAVAAKLLELTSYLPYELEAGDCAFVRDAVRASRSGMASSSNRRALSAQLVRAAVRLLRVGRRRDAWTLLPPGLVPQFAARLAWSLGLSDAMRRRLHGLALRARRAPTG